MAELLAGAVILAVAVLFIAAIIAGVRAVFKAFGS